MRATGSGDDNAAGVTYGRGMDRILLVLSFVLLASPAAAEFQAATRTHAPELKPPAQQAGAGIHGWALVCVSVKADGTVSDARVIDVSPNPEFAEAGRKAALGWKFRPARLDGEPVDSSNVCGLQVFTLATAPSEKTQEKLAEVASLVDAEEYDEARRKVGDLAEEGPLTLAQAAQLQLLESRIAADDGEQAKVIDAIERATVARGRFLSGEALATALGARFAGLAHQRRYGEALELYQQFEKIEGGAKPMVVHGKANEEIRKLAKGDQSFVVSAELEPALAAEGGVWRHRPLRRELGARKLEGKLDAIVIDCDLRTMRLDYAEEVSWRIPDSWGRCTVYAEGEPGTTFDLLEYGPEPVAGADD